MFYLVLLWGIYFFYKENLWLKKQRKKLKKLKLQSNFNPRGFSPGVFRRFVKKIMLFNVEKPEDAEDFDVYNKAYAYKFAIDDICDECRKVTKYGDPTKDLEEFIEKIRAIIADRTS